MNENMLLSELPDGVLHAIADKLGPISYHNLRCVSSAFRRVLEVKPLTPENFYAAIKEIVNKYDKRLLTLRITGNNAYIEIVYDKQHLPPRFPDWRHVIYEIGMIDVKVPFAGVVDDVTRCKIIQNHRGVYRGAGVRDWVSLHPTGTFQDLFTALETHTSDLRAEVKRRGAKKKETLQLRSVYDEIGILLLDGNRPTVEVTAITVIKPRRRIES